MRARWVTFLFRISQTLSAALILANSPHDSFAATERMSRTLSQRSSNVLYFQEEKPLPTKLENSILIPIPSLIGSARIEEIDHLQIVPIQCPAISRKPLIEPMQSKSPVVLFVEGLGKQGGEHGIRFVRPSSDAGGDFPKSHSSPVEILLTASEGEAGLSIFDGLFDPRRRRAPVAAQIPISLGLEEYGPEPLRF